MTGKGFLIALGVVAAILVAFTLGFWMNGQNKIISPTPTPAANQEPTSQNSPTQAPIASENIMVTAPKENEAVSGGFILRGEARVFENVLNYKLLDENGKVLAKDSLEANALDTGQFGPFLTAVHFTTTAKTGTLEVYSLSPKDGSEINKVTIPLIFN